jgi:hypothetical protein
MSKTFLKTIAAASTISLLLLAAPVLAMWDELEEQDQHRIVKAHITDIEKNTKIPIPSMPPTAQGVRKAAEDIFVPYLKSLSPIIHTGGGFANYPKITLEETCDECKKEIKTAYVALKEKQKQNAANEQVTQLALQLEEQKQETLRLKIKLAELEKKTPK